MLTGHDGDSDTILGLDAVRTITSPLSKFPVLLARSVRSFAPMSN
jgi:hypothetical protein